MSPRSPLPSINSPIAAKSPLHDRDTYSTPQPSPPDSSSSSALGVGRRTPSAEEPNTSIFASGSDLLSGSESAAPLDTLVVPDDFLGYGLSLDPLELQTPLSYYQPGSRTSSIAEVMPGLNEGGEEEDENWPSATIISSSAPINNNWPEFLQASNNMPLIAQPRMAQSTPEMLMLRFDRQTCGILSVKDGPTENSWRTLIWPLTRNSTALYHAIASMTAFHGSYDDPSLIARGAELESESQRCLDVQINDNDMGEDAAVATLLVLGFAESWKCPTSTTLCHIRKARKLVIKAIMRDQGSMKSLRSGSQEAMRLRHICNAYVFMDVVSRLTNPAEDEDEDISSEILSAVNYPTQGLMAVDPLLGSAVSLFPLVSTAAKLVQKARSMERSSLALVSEAYGLQMKLQQWKPPSPAMLERLVDQIEVLNTIQTAEALRYAILLYLHQAVPELPSLPAAELARKAVMKLATTPPMSRATNLQIFPLFAAGCEMTSEEDRNWVKTRWEALIKRLRVNNVDRSWDIVQEVWARRDAYEKRKKERRDQCILGICPSRRSLLKRFKDLILILRLYVLAAQSQATLSESLDGNLDAYTFDELNADKQSTKKPSQEATTSDRPSSGSIEVSTEELEEEYQIRGSLHWLRVLEDRQWRGIFNPMSYKKKKKISPANFE